MDERSISRVKADHAEFYTLADQPIDFSVSITLRSEQIKSICASREGQVIPLCQLIDNIQDTEASLRKRLAFSYSLEDPDKLPLNFLLLDAQISGIQSPDNNGGMVIGGSIAFPQMYSATTPIDELSPCGGYRKMLDLDSPMYFVNGQLHAFLHTLKHNTVSESYPLVTRHSKLNPLLLHPDGTIKGSGGVPHAMFADLSKKAMLHAHSIDNESMYPDASYSTVTEVLSADSSGHGGVKSQHLVAIPNKAWPRSWYAQRKACDREQGAVVPLADYAVDVYQFIDGMNQSRCTNFTKCGIWWNIECLKDVPSMKAILSLRVVPIVPRHKEGKELVPWNNFVKHLMTVLTKTDKPFENQ